jgi:hypothetical protein
MTKQQKAAWDAGFFSYDAGQPVESNPYRPETETPDLRLALAWLAGYDTARATSKTRPACPPTPVFQPKPQKEQP